MRQTEGSQAAEHALIGEQIKRAPVFSRGLPLVKNRLPRFSPPVSGGFISAGRRVSPQGYGRRKDCGQNVRQAWFENL
jgi:hypothetical protein